LYVDNFNIARHYATIKCFKVKFTTKFDIKDLKLMKLLLGIQVSQWEKKVTISQATYMKSIIATFTLKDDFFNSVSISKRDCDNIIKAVREENLHSFANKYLYWQILKKLNYASIDIRPDISFAIRFLERYTVKLTQLQFSTLMQLL
jgi:Reverse transcriptase (RNA-dependent DNA polymerase)